MTAVMEERSKIETQLAGADLRLDDGRQTLEALLDLLADPQELYRQASRRARRVLNKALFARLYLDGDEDNRPAVVGDELTDAVVPIVTVQRRQVNVVGYRQESGTPLLGGTAFVEPTLTDLLEQAWGQRCSSKTVLVGDTGFEPVTSFRVKADVTISSRPKFPRLDAAAVTMEDIRWPVRPSVSRQLLGMKEAIKIRR